MELGRRTIANLLRFGRSIAAAGVFALAMLPGNAHAVSQGDPVDIEIWAQMPISVTLDAALATYASTASTGQSFLVTMTVTNNGGVVANNVTAQLWELPASTAGVTVTGPAPATANIPAGGMQVYSWTVDANTVGTISWSGTATADGPVSSPLRTTPVVTVVNAANLVAQVAATPNSVCAGQTFEVVVTMTNTGQAAVNGLTVRPFYEEGAASGNTPISGPTPAVPASLAGGATSKHTWVYQAVAPIGVGTYSTTVTGTDANGAWAVLSNPSSAAVTEAGAAAFDTYVSTVPSTVSTGQGFQVRFTVTNTGGTTATAIAPQLRFDPAGSVTWSAGPIPVSVASLAPGASAEFIYGYFANTAGITNFSVTASGTDCAAATVTGWDVGSVTIQSAANLVATLWVDATTAVVGQTITATMTVSNTGGTAANTVTPTLSIAGIPTTPSGPLPASTNIGAGANATFVWTFVVNGTGAGNFTGGATGSDALSAQAKSTPGVTSPNIAAITPANLVAHVVVSPSVICTGDPFTVAVTVSNTGQAAVTGFNIEPIYEDGAGAANTPGAGPVPALPGTLAGGATGTYVWNYTEAGPIGLVSYSTTATGTDAVAGWAVSSGVAAKGLTEGSAAALEGIVAVNPPTASIGQLVYVNFTVTNTGGSNATGVVPAISPGAGLTPVGGPFPPSVGVLGPGAKQVFQWQYTAAAVATVGMTATANGVSCGAAAITTSAAGSVTIQAAANLTATFWLDTVTLVAGQTVVATMTVSNTGGTQANGVVPTLSIAGVPVVPTGPAPASANIPAGGNQTFVWSFVTAGAGAGNFSGGASGTDALSGQVKTVSGVTGPNFTALTPATIVPAIDIVTPGAVYIGRTITASVTLYNTGQVSATLTMTHTVTGGVSLGNASAGSPIGPLSVNALSATIITWTYLPVSCGTGSIDVVVTGTEAITGNAIGPLASSKLVTIYGRPSSVVATSNVPAARVGRSVELAFAVMDDCPTPNAVPGIPVTLVVVAGDGRLQPYGTVTDATGALRARLYLGDEAGQNMVRGDAIGGVNPSGTVMVQGTVPTTPEPYLTQNLFNPMTNDKLQIRTMVPSPMRLSVRIYNFAGELVRVIGDEEVPAGVTVWEWDGRNASNAYVGNGTYFIQIVSGNNSQIKRVIVLKR